MNCHHLVTILKNNYEIVSKKLHKLHGAPVSLSEASWRFATGVLFAAGLTLPVRIGIGERVGEQWRMIF